MLELISVEVENFRSFSAATFYPLGLGQGMTAINGPNGSGKSSLATHALLWALYGITPDGVPVKAMRRQGSTEEVRASVTFRHDGQEICVSRYLKGKNDTTIARIIVDGIEQTNISARTAASWVTRRLGVDAEGFATAFVIRQKEVDALVRARPAERRALIERLAGIHHMSAALSQARERARTAQAMVSALGEVPALEDLEAAEEAALRDYATAQTALARAQEEEASARKDYERARERAKEVEEIARAISRFEAKAAVLQEKIRNAEDESRRLSDQVEAADLLPDAEAALARAEEEVRALEETLRAADIAVADAERDNAAAADCEKRVRELESELNELDAASAEVRVLADSESELRAAADQALSDVQDAVSRLGGIEAEVSRLTASLALLETSSNGSDANCPTCSSPLESPAELIAHLNNDLGTAESERERGLAQLSHLEEAASHARHRLSEAQKAQAAASASDESIKRLTLRLERAREEMHRAFDRAESSAEAAHDALKAKEVAGERLPDARQETAAAATALRKAQAAQDATTRLEVLRAETRRYRESLDQEMAVAAPLQDQLAGESVDALRKTVEDLLERSLTATTIANDAKTHCHMCQRDAEEASHRLTLGRESQERRLMAETQAEQAQHLAAALEEFRRDRVARLAPELSEVASDLVMVMTDGRYSAIELDEDFTPVVTEAETGLERPAAWLSGGEESAVALALRIAIGEVVAGQRGGLLVLDEVLTAQDQARRSATMRAIRALPRQVVTINHVSEATDMVDLVAAVVPEGEGGSRIEQFAPTAATEVSDLALVTSD